MENLLIGIKSKEYCSVNKKKRTLKRILEVIFFTSIMVLVLNVQNPIIKNIFNSGFAKWRGQVLKYFGQSARV